MKKKTAPSLLVSVVSIILICSLQCKKTVDELSKLPPITQEGKNTFGCLVNGNAWILEGYDPPRSKLEVFVDPSDSLIDIRAFRIKNGQKTNIFFQVI